MWSYRCAIDRVVDGDTMDLLIDLGFHTYMKIRVRLNDVDAPEIRGPERPDGLLVMQAVEDWVDVPREEDFPFTVRTEKTGKYGRWIAEVTDGTKTWSRVVLEAMG